MTLVLQILIAVVVLVGLITVIMSVKNWHWAQMLLLLGIFLSAVGTLLLGLEVYRIHRNLRQGLPQLEQQIADLEADSAALELGTRDPALVGRVTTAMDDPAAVAAKAEAMAESLTPDQTRAMQSIFGTSDEARAQQFLRQWANNLANQGRNPRLTAKVAKALEQMSETNELPSTQYWTRRLEDLHRQRGRVWRGVVPAGAVDPATGRIVVQIPQPQPHGMEKDAIVFAFEQGEPNAANPEQGAQYLGEFRAVEVRPEGATLEAVIKLDPRTGNRLVRNQQQAAQGQPRPWALYESMPTDRHEIFAEASEEELQKMLPPASVEEYIRHGDEATPDDDEYHRAGFDDQKRRVGPDNADKAVEWRYDRPLRDYAYLFDEAARQRVVSLADREALIEDIKKLKTADESAKALGALRTKEIEALGSDLKFMERDRKAIESLLATIKTQLDNARRMLNELLAFNVNLAGQLMQRQLGLLEVIDDRAPAPDAFLGPQ